MQTGRSQSGRCPARDLELTAAANSLSEDVQRSSSRPVLARTLQQTATVFETPSTQKREASPRPSFVPLATTWLSSCPVHTPPPVAISHVGAVCHARSRLGLRIRDRGSRQALEHLSIGKRRRLIAYDLLGKPDAKLLDRAKPFGWPSRDRVNDLRKLAWFA